MKFAGSNLYLIIPPLPDSDLASSLTSKVLILFDPKKMANVYGAPGTPAKGKKCLICAFW